MKKIFVFMGLFAVSSVMATAINQKPNIHDHSSMAYTDPTIINANAGHSMANMNMSENSKNHEHHNNIASGNNQAKLSINGNLTPNQPVSLVIDIVDKNSKAVKKFDTFQEKLMHLIIVSDDLQIFSHLHPTYQENGRFEVEATFAQSGGYTIFSDYKPVGQKEQVSVLKTQVSRQSISTPSIDLKTIKTVDNTKVDLSFSQPTLKAGEEVMLTFDLKQSANNQPITDLQAYLGEKGHLVIIKNSSSLTRSDYIHAHAIKDISQGKIQFMTTFPEPGKYKLWGQFNRNGKIIVADFWVNVI